MRSPAILIAATLLAACGGKTSSLGNDVGPAVERTGGGASGGGTDPALAGVLTAGVWDDNLNYGFFKNYYQWGAATVPGAPTFSDGDQAEAHYLSTRRSPGRSLDIALVIDTTGSMGDEIAYLKAEFSGLAESLGQLYPAIPQRWALVAYRDQGDDYVVRAFDFDADVAAQERVLAGFHADGGDDFPEAPDQALARVSKMSWTDTPGAARLVFWVADAPHHVQRAREMSSAIQALRDLGIHIYPVAASGVDELTEYTMRASAQLTLGRYVFLTDDSGVGDSHLEPSIPCYWVTRLNHAMVRVIRSEVEGSTVQIDLAQVIRSSGSPKDGRCANSDYIF